jgi:hypothetical protein
VGLHGLLGGAGLRQEQPRVLQQSRPASVSRGRGRRSKSTTPSSPSSWRTCIDTAGWLMPSCSAAREKLPLAATASNSRSARSCRSFISCLPEVMAFRALGTFPE